jgi:hypothetical protein
MNIGSASLRLHLASEDREEIERTVFPFSVITDTDPFSRLMKGAFVTDAGSVVRDVFLLVQKDRYLLVEDTLRPVTNLDVDHAWQSAFSSYSERRDNTLLLFPSRLGDQGKFSAWKSLLFCTRARHFFHPPCPECGIPLEQCQDDTLLGKSGLQPYRHSLKRYLFCPSCTAAGQEPNFYVFKLDRRDSARLRDWRGLVVEFGSLPRSHVQKAPMPCGPCSLWEECYGPDRKALSRIVPFAFYPFYMLVFEAMSLTALDFVSLLSGASLGEIEARLRGRGESGLARCLRDLNHTRQSETPFLSDGHSRAFFEILFLKLSFLADVVRGFPKEKRLAHPGVRPSCDAIWVKLADQNGLLPWYWNFRTVCLDVGGFVSRSGYAEASYARSDPSFLGLVWFYTLLVNEKQDMTQVTSSIEEFAANPLDRNRPFPPETAEGGKARVFSPANVFWNPEGKEPRHDWRNPWHEAMSLGWSLLTAGGEPEAGWSEEEFLSQVNGLRAKVKDRLFTGDAHPTADLPDTRQLDRMRIHDALVNIHRTWEARVEEERKSLTPPRGTESMETVILSLEPPPAVTPGAPEPSECTPEETTIIPAPAEREGVPPALARLHAADEIIEETVILSAADLRGYGEWGAQPDEKAGPATQENPPADAGPALRDGAVEESGDDEVMEETVILSVQAPAKNKKRREVR